MPTYKNLRTKPTSVKVIAKLIIYVLHNSVTAQSTRGTKFSTQTFKVPTLNFLYSLCIKTLAEELILNLGVTLITKFVVRFKQMWISTSKTVK
jgi:hypothetical protein